MAKYCAYQERCHWEVECKLKQMNMTPLSIDVIINFLIEEGFLNQERFARCFARGKLNLKHWGWRKIEWELRQRKISDYIIDDAFDEISPYYDQSFYDIATSKWESLDKTDIFKAKQKLINHLLYKGWESHKVYEFVQSI